MSDVNKIAAIAKAISDARADGYCAGIEAAGKLADEWEVTASGPVTFKMNELAAAIRALARAATTEES